MKHFTTNFAVKKDTATEMAKKREQERLRLEKLAETNQASRYRRRSRSRSYSPSPRYEKNEAWLPFPLVQKLQFYVVSVHSVPCLVFFKWRRVNMPNLIIRKRFIPISITKKGIYPLYTFHPKIPSLITTLSICIFIYK